jgi:hypothetical protein
VQNAARRGSTLQPPPNHPVEAIADSADDQPF